MNCCDSLTSAFNFVDHDCSTELLACVVWVGEVAMTKTLADSGKLDLRSRFMEDAGSVDAGGKGVLTSFSECECEA